MDISIATEREHAMNLPPGDLPRILLVEDDAVSRAFLAAAAEATPARVDSADSIHAAVTLAARHRYALWLVDANLPDGRGVELLARLRADDAHAAAVAHTADTTRAAADGLIAAGFGEVLVKPLPAAAVQAAIRRALGRPSGSPVSTDPAALGPKLPVWDDAAAARALAGNTAHVATLRGLFLGELPGVVDRIERAAATGDAESISAELHKLRASCGFVGAARLAAAAQALGTGPRSDALLARFREAARDTVDQAPSPSG